MEKICSMLLFALLVMSCSQERPVKNCETFAELPDPNPDTLSWVNPIKNGLMASFVSIDKKYPKSVMPNMSDFQTTDTLEGWKGERVSTQILLWSPVDVAQVEFEFGDFKSSEGVLPGSIAQARFVRYVMSDEFGEKPCMARNAEDYPTRLMPDMLDSLSCFNLDAKTVRPVWITIDIPRDAKKGLYTGSLKVYARGEQSQVFTLDLDVIDKVLPEASQWTMHLDLWQHPSAIARVSGLEIWSDAHFEKMKPQMQMLADLGQKVITANVNKDPWNHQCYDAYEDMIVWTKHKDGTWSYDYTVFDKWVEFMMNEIGIRKAINCYSMIPWNNELHYVDEATQQTINVKADPGTKVFTEMWVPFLSDFQKHLKEKGWLEITNIAMDERKPEDMQETMKVLKKYAPELGVALADNHQSYRRYPDIKDMCAGAEAPVDKADIKARREKGLITTYYVCCAHEFPNIFTFSDPAEATYISWYAVAADFDGFLRWAYNSWVENPLTDARFRKWPSGDTYMVYPDARSSIRYERMLEGVQDFEKIQILRKEFSEKGQMERLDSLNQTIQKFDTVERTATWNKDLNEAKKLVNQLSKEN